MLTKFSLVLGRTCSQNLKKLKSWENGVVKLLYKKNKIL